MPEAVAAGVGRGRRRARPDRAPAAPVRTGPGSTTRRWTRSGLRSGACCRALVYTRLTLRRGGSGCRRQGGAVRTSPEGRVAASSRPSRGREVAAADRAGPRGRPPSAPPTCRGRRAGAGRRSRVLPTSAPPSRARSGPAGGVKAALPALAAVITERRGRATGARADRAGPACATWRTGLILFAAYAPLSTLVGIDWATVVDTWQNATWSWVAIGVVVAQGTLGRRLTRLDDDRRSRLVARWPLADPVRHPQDRRSGHFCDRPAASL